MAKLIIEDKEQEVKDGENIMEIAEDMGVPFGCRTGACTVCKVEVLKGMENLNEITDNERDMGMEGNERLACQLSINKGTVKLKY